MFFYIKLFIYNKLILLLEYVIPKRKDLWLFGMDDGGGSRLSGNSWHFLNYVKENCPHIKIACITSHALPISILEAQKIDYAKGNTFKSFWLGLRSKVYLICGELHDEIPNFSKRGTFKVHLWHGVPLKKIYYLSPKMMEKYEQRSDKVRLLEKIRGVVGLEDYDAIIYTSEKLKEIMAKSFNNRNLFLTGQPRDDIFYKDISRKHLLQKTRLKEFEDKKLIVYLPTFRDSKDKKDNYKVFTKNQNAQSILRKYNAVILQKDHNTLVSERIRDENIIHLADSVDTQELIMLADILITDYSSVYVDFLNLKRPIIFFCYDIKSYLKNDRGLNFDYFDKVVTPGPKVQNEEDLLMKIEEYLSEPLKDHQVRMASLDFFHYFQDGNNSKRVYEMICKQVGLNV